MPPSLCCPGSRNAEFFHRCQGMPCMIRSLYLAGPDVFRPDARERGRELKALCAEFGIEGLFPLDQEVPAHLVAPAEQAAWCVTGKMVSGTIPDAKEKRCQEQFRRPVHDT